MSENAMESLEILGGIGAAASQKQPLALLKEIVNIPYMKMEDAGGTGSAMEAVDPPKDQSQGLQEPQLKERRLEQQKHPEVPDTPPVPDAPQQVSAEGADMVDKDNLAAGNAAGKDNEDGSADEEDAEDIADQAKCSAKQEEEDDDDDDEKKTKEEESGDEHGDASAGEVAKTGATSKAKAKAQK